MNRKDTEFKRVMVHYPDEKMWVTLKVYPDQTREEVIKNFEDRRSMFKNPMRKVIGKGYKLL
jgi:ketosteroid isomerase-like protein